MRKLSPATACCMESYLFQAIPPKLTLTLILTLLLLHLHTKVRNRIKMYTRKCWHSLSKSKKKLL